MTKPTIRYDSDQAAHKETVTGWVSASGRFWGNDEHMARWDGCTHIICACGEATEKGWICCAKCRSKQDHERWEAMPLVAYDGGAFCLHDGDRFFFDVDEFYDWCEDEEIQPSTVRLVAADPTSFSEVSEEHWHDDLPEDGELPCELADALEAFNAAIRAYKAPACYRPANRRIVMQDPT